MVQECTYHWMNGQRILGCDQSRPRDSAQLGAQSCQLWWIITSAPISHYSTVGIFSEMQRSEVGERTKGCERVQQSYDGSPDVEPTGGDRKRMRAVRRMSTNIFALFRKGE